jgi:hypothetical protein
MAHNALLIGWGLPVRGREQKAMEVFGNSIEYWTGLQAGGQIESFQVAVLDPYGGDLSGFALLRGSHEQLDQLRASPDFQKLATRALLFVEGLRVVNATADGAAHEQMALYQGLLSELA